MVHSRGGVRRLRRWDDEQLKAAAAAWSPLDLASLVAWWDFSDAAKLFTDAGVTPVSADGQSIYQANDKSPSGYHLTQATAGNRPTYKTNAINGLSVCRFAADGINFDDWLRNALFTFDLRARTVAIVCKELGAGRDNSGVVIFTPSTGEDYNSLTGTVYSVGLANPPRNFQSLGSISSDYLLLDTTDGPPTNLGIYVERKAIGGTGYFYRNGGAAVATDASYTEFATSTNGVLLGARFLAGAISVAPTHALYGDIGEVVICSQQLSVADTNKLGSYLQGQWGPVWSDIS
jgi:hypothetical protein